MAEVAVGRPEKGPLETLLDVIMEKHGIAVNDFILQEWEDTCQSEYFNIWLTELIKTGRMTKFPTGKVGQLRKTLNINCGLPRSSRDIYYVLCATQAYPHYVLSQDIDLYDPREKRGNATSKARARRDRYGQLCCYVKREFSVTIGCLCHCIKDLSLGTELAPSALPDCHRA
jgi:hypothetical protein